MAFGTRAVSVKNMGVFVQSAFYVSWIDSCFLFARVSISASVLRLRYSLHIPPHHTQKCTHATPMPNPKHAHITHTRATQAPTWPPEKHTCLHAPQCRYATPTPTPTPTPTHTYLHLNPHPPPTPTPTRTPTPTPTPTHTYTYTYT